jgi:long-chain fatty acid transport protein
LIQNSHIPNRQQIYALLLFFFSQATSLLANDYNYKNTIVGERAFGLAGAYTALSDDTSGCYYNPAGLAFVERNTLSLSATVYSQQTMTTKNAFSYLGVEGVDAESSVLTPIPSTVGTLKKFNENTTAGFCAVVPDSSRITIDTAVDVGDNAQYSLRRNLSDQILLVGPALGYKLKPNLAVGFSLFYASRTYSLTNTLTNTEDLSAEFPPITISTSDTFINHGSILVQTGIRYQPTEKLYLGFSARSTSYKLSGEGSVFLTIVDENENFTNGRNFLYSFKNLEGDTEYPLKLSTGVAYGEKYHYFISFDTEYNIGRNFNLTQISLSGTDFAIGQVEQSNIFNFAVGSEYYFKREVPVRFGIYTNLSANDAAKVLTDQNQESIDYYGVTLGFGWESQNSSTNVGINYAIGSGKSSRSFGETAENMTVKDLSSSQLGILVGGSYYFD